MPLISDIELYADDLSSISGSFGMNHTRFIRMRACGSSTYTTTHVYYPLCRSVTQFLRVDTRLRMHMDLRLRSRALRKPPACAVWLFTRFARSLPCLVTASVYPRHDPLRNIDANVLCCITHIYSNYYIWTTIVDDFLVNICLVECLEPGCHYAASRYPLKDPYCVP